MTDGPPPGWKPAQKGQAWGETPDHWPKHVKHVAADEDLMGVGDDGGLYWDGKPVQVGKRIDLTIWQIVYGVAALLVAAIAAGAAAVSALVDLNVLP